MRAYERFPRGNVNHFARKRLLAGEINFPRSRNEIRARIKPTRRDGKATVKHVLQLFRAYREIRRSGGGFSKTRASAAPPEKTKFQRLLSVSGGYETFVSRSLVYFLSTCFATFSFSFYSISFYSILFPYTPAFLIRFFAVASITISRKRTILSFQTDISLIDMLLS